MFITIQFYHKLFSKITVETGWSIVLKFVIIFFRLCLVAICQVIAANSNSNAITAN